MHLLEKCERVFGNQFLTSSINHKNQFNNKFIILLSADESCHQDTKEGYSNVITCNVSIIGDRLLQNGFTSTQSQHILTTMQVVADEHLDVCMHIFHDFMKNINNLNVDQLPSNYHHLQIEFQVINNGKMIYALSQHSLYSRKCHPYCICKCKRGKVQECRKLNKNEYEKLYRNSLKYYIHVLSKKYKVKEHNELDVKTFTTLMKEHRDWCNNKNYGVNHFGLEPKLLNLLKTRYNILHLKLAVTEKIIAFIRFYLGKFSYHIKEGFIKILLSVWGSFYVDCYEVNKNLNILH